MNRKEEIHHEAYVRHGFTYQNVRVFEEGAEWADKTMIEKVCRFLKMYLSASKTMLDDFKEAMEK